MYVAFFGFFSHPVEHVLILAIVEPAPSGADVDGRPPAVRTRSVYRRDHRGAAASAFQQTSEDVGVLSLVGFPGAYAAALPALEYGCDVILTLPRDDGRVVVLDHAIPNRRLGDKAQIIKSPTEIEVLGPYARYQYYGKVMVGKAPKTVTDRDLKYDKTKNPQAGPFWDRTLMAAEGDQIVSELQGYINRK